MVAYHIVSSHSYFSIDCALVMSCRITKVVETLPQSIRKETVVRCPGLSVKIHRMHNESKP